MNCDGFSVARKQLRIVPELRDDEPPDFRILPRHSVSPAVRQSVVSNDTVPKIIQDEVALVAHHNYDHVHLTAGDAGQCQQNRAGRPAASDKRVAFGDCIIIAVTGCWM